MSEGVTTAANVDDAAQEMIDNYGQLTALSRCAHFKSLCKRDAHNAGVYDFHFAWLAKYWYRVELAVAQKGCN